MSDQEHKRIPSWIRSKRIVNDDSKAVTEAIVKYSLNTVCTSANCPNICECFSARTATLMILGDVCTRGCAFCGVEKRGDYLLDKNEPENAAQFVRDTELEYVVLTSVTRDDLPDGGASHFADTVTAIKKMNPSVFVEVLVPDFGGSFDSVDAVLHSGVNVFAHNIETVKRLYGDVRKGADYQRSLDILKYVAGYSDKVFVKSGIMLGLSETKQEVEEVIDDMKLYGTDFLTIGQYLRPSRKALPVVDFIEEDMFIEYKKYALGKGFQKVASGPFVRSSYKAKEFFTNK